MDEKLTAREARFIVFYLGEARFNATEAARRAGYSAKTARQAGSRLLSHVVIRARIDAALAAEAATQAEVLSELRAVAFAPTTHFMVTIRSEYEDQFGLHRAQIRQDYSAKLKALELIGKHHRMFIDVAETTNRTVIREYRDGDDGDDGDASADGEQGNGDDGGDSDGSTA